MLIFDNFRDRHAAMAFADHVHSTYGRKAHLCTTVGEAQQLDPFPFALQPPIVLVERDTDHTPHIETTIERVVTQFLGQFAGT